MEMLTQAEVEEQIQNLLQRLEEGTRTLASLAVAQARSEVEFKRSFALAYTGIRDGAQELRKQQATLVSIDLFERHRLDSAVHATQQELLRTLRSELDALRTIAANIRGVS